MINRIAFKSIESFTSKCLRKSQEDFFHADEKKIIVADGMGGMNLGRDGSKVICESLNVYFEKYQDRLIRLQSQTLYDYLASVLNSLSDNDSIIGVTLSSLVIWNGGIVAIHIGDCRIYNFDKNGLLKWRTRDHSVVQELFEAGVINEESMMTHPKRNVVTKYLSSDPNIKFNIEIKQLREIENGDRVLLCTDGVTEIFTDTMLEELLINSDSNDSALDVIESECSENSHDNSTAILATIQLESF